MNNKEFALIRHHLGQSQQGMAKLLCVSTKAVQSFEEGWRNIPAYAERQLLFLLALKRAADEKSKTCWKIKNCPLEQRQRCNVWKYHAGHFCWFVNGTFCMGQDQGNWKQKINFCRQCAVFQSLIPHLV
jgi:DNA-binding XRE family transcriptional regulator